MLKVITLKDLPYSFHFVQKQQMTRHFKTLQNLCQDQVAIILLMQLIIKMVMYSTQSLRVEEQPLFQEQGNGLIILLYVVQWKCLDQECIN